MGYPGDQGKPGDWPPEQSPQAPYGPGAERPEAAPYGNDKDETPFAPRGQVPPGGDAFGSDPLAAEGFGVPPGFSGAQGFGGAQGYGGRPGDPNGPPGGFNEPPGGFTGPQGGYDGPPGGFESPGGYDDHDSFGGPGDPGHGPGPSGGPTPPERRRNLPLIIGGAAVAGLVLIGGGIGLSSMLKDDPAPTPAPSAAAAQKTPAAKPTPSVPPLEPVKLRSRTTDPKPLTLREAFGKSSFKSGGAKYVRTAWNAKRNCTSAVGGATLGKTLKQAACSQTLRATYARSDGKLIGTVGVFNLRSENAAKVAVKAAGAKDAFLQALPGKGTTKTIGKGEALGTAEARGHYLVMTWVQRPDGKKIPSTYHKAVSTFSAQVIKNSNLSFALAFRETEGKPFRD